MKYVNVDDINVIELGSSSNSSLRQDEAQPRARNHLADHDEQGEANDENQQPGEEDLSAMRRHFNL